MKHRPSSLLVSLALIAAILAPSVSAAQPKTLGAQTSLAAGTQRDARITLLYIVVITSLLVVTPMAPITIVLAGYAYPK